MNAISISCRKYTDKVIITRIINPSWITEVLSLAQNCRQDISHYWTDSWHWHEDAGVEVIPKLATGVTPGSRHVAPWALPSSSRYVASLELL